MRQLTHWSGKATLLSAAALAASSLAWQAQAQSNATDTTTPAESQRGVPGTDVDINTPNANSRNNGVPGVDVDVNNPNRPRTGAGSDTRTDVDVSVTQRAPRADRN